MSIKEFNRTGRDRPLVSFPTKFLQKRIEAFFQHQKKISGTLIGG